MDELIWCIVDTIRRERATEEAAALTEHQRAMLKPFEERTDETVWPKCIADRVARRRTQKRFKEMM